MTHLAAQGVNAARVMITRIVKEQPGIHFRGLGRAAHVSSAGQLRHHLDRLERDGELVELEDGRYKRFFVAGQHDPKVRPEIARFARQVPRRIARLLLSHSMNRTELRRSLGCADSTLGYHLSRMVLLGDLAKTRGANCCQYSLTREELLRGLLVAAPDPPVGPRPLPAPVPVPPVPYPSPEPEEGHPQPLAPPDGPAIGPAP